MNQCFWSGDILGRALKNLDGLLQMPYGCGEQNMALLAPNIYILHYLKGTQQLTAAIMEKATNFLTSGKFLLFPLRRKSFESLQHTRFKKQADRRQNISRSFWSNASFSSSVSKSHWISQISMYTCRSINKWSPIITIATMSRSWCPCCYRIPKTAQLQKCWRCLHHIWNRTRKHLVRTSLIKHVTNQRGYTGF